MCMYMCMWEGAPADVIEAFLGHLDLPSLAVARAVCKQWCSAACSSATVLASARNTDGLLKRAEICKLFGLTHAEAMQLPRRPFVTRRGLTCWLFSPPDVAAKAFELAKTRSQESIGHKRKVWEVIRMSRVVE